MTREWFAITSCSNEVRAKFSANQKQEVSLSKLRVFQRLTSTASIFLALSFAQFTVCVRWLVKPIFWPFRVFPQLSILGLKNYSFPYLSFSSSMLWSTYRPNMNLRSLWNKEKKKGLTLSHRYHEAYCIWNCNFFVSRRFHIAFVRPNVYRGFIW